MDIGIDPTNIGMYQPKLKNRWKAVFLNLGGPRSTTIGYESILTNALEMLSSEPNAITMQCTNFQRPSLQFQEVELHRYNSVAYVGSKHSWNECTMTLEDDVTSKASRKLREQLERQQYLIGDSGQMNILGAGLGTANLLGTAATASEYKFACTVAMLDGGINELERWHLQGCWFKSVNWGDLAYSDGDKVTIEVTMRFDHAVQRFPNVEYGHALGGAGNTE